MACMPAEPLWVTLRQTKTGPSDGFIGGRAGLANGGVGEDADFCRLRRICIVQLVVAQNGSQNLARVASAIKVDDPAASSHSVRAA